MAGRVQARPRDGGREESAIAATATGRHLLQSHWRTSPGKVSVRIRGASTVPPAPITLRTDFNPLALWEPGVRTDANGRAQVPVRLPGSLTRYRVMAVAVSGARHFGWEKRRSPRVRD